MSQELRKKITHHERELRRLRKLLRQSKGLGPKRRGMGCRDRDEALKAERGYSDPSTFVRRDGSEKLVGVDWRKRVDKLAERSGGKCEWIIIVDRGLVPPHMKADVWPCDEQADDPHHIVKRSIRRDDRMLNLAHLCRVHHYTLDPRKLQSGKPTFALKPAPENKAL